MRITDIRETAMRINSTMRNAVFDFSEMTTSIVAVKTDVVRDSKPVVGFAFNSTGRYACGAAMRDRLIPRVLRAEPKTLMNAAGDNLDPAKILAAMLKGEKPGGDVERSNAAGTIEVACWDAVAKIEGLPLHRSLANRFRGGQTVDRMFCYVGGGWYVPGTGVEQLEDEIRRRLDDGYTLMKIKVGGVPLRDDVARLDAAIKLMGAGDRLAVDANCGFADDRARLMAYAKALAPYRLRWFEEPVHPNDYALNAELAALYPPPLATGENLFSMEDVRNLVRHGGMRPGHDVIQTDTPQSYGITTLVRTLAMLGEHAWQPASVLPHGGNQMSLHIAGGLGLGMCESYPGVFGMFAGFADDARIDAGYLTMPDRPGIGFEAQAELYKVMAELAR
jgi:L-alanine-DL-glutamate epimerase-like enolase superfamily enzyme